MNRTERINLNTAAIHVTAPSEMVVEGTVGEGVSLGSGVAMGTGGVAVGTGEGAPAQPARTIKIRVNARIRRIVRPPGSGVGGIPPGAPWASYSGLPPVPGRGCPSDPPFSAVR